MPVQLMGRGISIGDLPWYQDDPTVWHSDAVALKTAYEMADITPTEIDYLHTHDCSHISGIVTAELSGYLPEGKGLHFAREGRLRFDGDRPMTRTADATPSATPGPQAPAPTPRRRSSRCVGWAVPSRSRTSHGSPWCTRTATQ